MESQYAPLSESCAKALADKAYEKRKVASQEIEKYFKNVVYRHIVFLNRIFARHSITEW